MQRLAGLVLALVGCAAALQAVLADQEPTLIRLAMGLAGLGTMAWGVRGCRAPLEPPG